MDNDDLPSNKLEIRDSQKKENNLGETFSCILGDENFKLFKLALLKGKRINLFANIFMQMNYTSQMSTCIDKLSGSRTHV